ncbi:hypothetical protein O6H91_09G123500 [Diphasiastrum complanatum]|uniref:Uncharacterized protein n=1 Tax=Diphasiastrum complanatum TaxID=34168 RepID=A0ACC2CU97_DIPCM|nr:hypothetical protein O6H91_09G123500 [Diphasiastrum complanatum]
MQDLRYLACLLPPLNSTSGEVLSTRRGLARLFMSHNWLKFKKACVVIKEPSKKLVVVCSWQRHRPCRLRPRFLKNVSTFSFMGYGTDSEKQDAGGIERYLTRMHEL